MACPEREVVAVIGDGGYQMTIQELGTVFQTKAAVKIVVLNNDFLGMVRQWQQLFFDKRYASTEMVNPDFVKIAEGYYLKASSRCFSQSKFGDEKIKSEKNMGRWILTKGSLCQRPYSSYYSFTWSQRRGWICL